MQVFSYNISPCFIETLLEFIGEVFVKDNLLQSSFENYIRKEDH
jgi:hypothetical protein